MIKKGLRISLLNRVELKVLLAWLALVLGLLFFLLLAEQVSKGSVQSVDEKILKAFRMPDNTAIPRGPEGLQEVMRDITSLGGGTVIFLITAFVAGYFLLQRNYNSLLLIIALVIGGSILGFELKEFFARERPMLVPHLMNVRHMSFPSGHSLMSAVMYISLAAILAEDQDTRRVKVFLLFSAIFLSFIIGISRLYLGVHYPTDVVAGWSIGTAWAAFCWYIAWRIDKRRFAKKVNNLNPKETLT